MDNQIPNYFGNPTKDINICYLANYNLNTNANRKRSVMPRNRCKKPMYLLMLIHHMCKQLLNQHITSLKCQ